MSTHLIVTMFFVALVLIFLVLMAMRGAPVGDGPISMNSAQAYHSLLQVLKQAPAKQSLSLRSYLQLLGENYARDFPSEFNELQLSEDLAALADAPKGQDSIEDRMHTLLVLEKSGVITASEVAEVRKRILDSM